MKVYHPDIEGLSQDVPKDAVDSWAEQGWLKSEPKKFKASEESPSA